MAFIKTLKDKDNNVIYPTTVVSAVFGLDNRPLETILSLKIDADKVYLKEEVDSMLNSLTKLQAVTVEALPTIGDTSKIYLVPSANAKEENIYDEYLYVENKWEQIGTTAIDLTGYAKTTDLDAYAKATDLEDYATKEALTQYTLENSLEVSLKENSANKVTTLDSTATDAQYPSAKAVYDKVAPLERNWFEERQEFDIQMTAYRNGPSTFTIHTGVPNIRDVFIVSRNSYLEWRGGPFWIMDGEVWQGVPGHSTPPGGDAGPMLGDITSISGVDIMPNGDLVFSVYIRWDLGDTPETGEVNTTIYWNAR